MQNLLRYDDTSTHVEGYKDKEDAFLYRIIALNEFEENLNANQTDGVILDHQDDFIKNYLAGQCLGAYSSSCV